MTTQTTIAAEMRLDSNGQGILMMPDGEIIGFNGVRYGVLPTRRFLDGIGARVEAVRLDNGSRRGVPVPHSAPVLHYSRVTLPAERLDDVRAFAARCAAWLDGTERGGYDAHWSDIIDA